MLRSQPQIGLVWAANDAMALGALEAAREAGRVPGKDILLGGIDLGHEALVAVSEGSLAVSIGGHFRDGARALLLARDHHHGRDFEPWSRRSPLVSATPESAARYRLFVEARGWREVDFTRFSRTASPHGEPPDFTLDSVLGQSRPPVNGRLGSATKEPPKSCAQLLLRELPLSRASLAKGVDQRQEFVRYGVLPCAFRSRRV